MVIDFSKVDIHEQPILILKNTSGVPLGTLSAASNVALDIKYNEVSTLDFNLPAYTDGVEVPNYRGVIGMRMIDVQDIGQFILMNPKETGDGIKQIKTCKAYSLEYEFTFKKLTLENNTYNFWNPAAPGGTILDIILEKMPSWSVGSIDSSLIGKYRTFEVAEENLYNFIKNTLQQSYCCIFDFDTYNRVINVRDVSSAVPTNPIYVSLQNLAKEISVEEDTESIVTRLDVNGAEGVDIRDVNPTGDNKIINLDYYMTADNFSQSVINKYNNWKARYESYQQPYYNKSIEYSLEVMRKTTEAAALVDLEGEMTSLENQQAVIIRAIAENLDDQSSLTAINAEIASKQREINAKKSEIANIDTRLQSILNELKDINEATNFQSAFTEAEYIAIDRFIKDDAISESSFVAQETSSYSNADYGNKLSSQTLSVSGSTVASTSNSSTKTIYEMRGGSLQLTGKVSANLIRAVIEKTTSGTYVATAYLGKGTIDGKSFEKACLSMSGTCGTVSSTGTTLSARSLRGYLYLTLNVSEYAKREVAWDLYEYGNEILDRISQPAYKFGVTSANFLFIEDFIEFKNSLKHGEKVYVGLSEEDTLAPIVIGLKYEYDSPQSLTLEFSDTYVSGDSSFRLADLLEQSVSMGKSVDVSKFTYSAFVDSGAHTQVKEFMTSALDVAKNAIMSSKDQAITWGDSGIRLRKWANEAKTAYDPCQVWMNNNSILMTSNNWATAEIAIGNFYDKNLGNLWGVVAPNIVGTLLAGSNLVIESAKKDGDIAVFKMDADGCTIHNSILSVTSDAKNTHILLDSENGIALGTYPLINADGSMNEDNYKFWVDEDGNLFFKGTLRATTGEFTGKVTATSGYIGGSTGWTIEGTYIYNGKPSYSSGDSGIYIGTDGIALGDTDSFVKAGQNGRLSCNNILATGGTIGGWTINAGKIYAGDGFSVKTCVMQAPSSSITWVFAAGGGTHSNYSDCPFRVDKAGNLYTSSITATGGTIGGCSIVDGVLKIQNANIDSISVSKISGGTNSENITFTGSFIAPNATITGNITATSGVIGCFRIDGGIKGYVDNVSSISLTNDGLVINNSLAKIQVGNFETFYDANAGSTYWRTNGALKIQGVQSGSVITSIELMTEAGTSSISSTISLYAARYGSNIHYKLYLKTSSSLLYPKTYTIYWQGGSPKLFGGTEWSEEINSVTISTGEGIIIENPGNAAIRFATSSSALSSATVYTFEDFKDVTEKHIFNIETVTQTSTKNDVLLMGNLIPKSANTYALGRSNMAWSAIYSQTGQVSSSDEALKHNILPLTDKYNDFFDLLDPISYIFNNNTSGRTHIGFGARSVKKAMLSVGLTTKDFAGYCEWNDDGVVGCGLRYEEFIALNTFQIKKIKERLYYLEKIVAELQNTD